jgi:hypothetical protein
MFQTTNQIDIGGFSWFFAILQEYDAIVYRWNSVCFFCNWDMTSVWQPEIYLHCTLQFNIVVDTMAQIKFGGLPFSKMVILKAALMAMK